MYLSIVIKANLEVPMSMVEGLLGLVGTWKQRSNPTRLIDAEEQPHAKFISSTS